MAIREPDDLSEIGAEIAWIPKPSSHESKVALGEIRYPEPVQESDREAWRLRVEKGYTYQKIADVRGYAAVQQAKEACLRYMRKIPRDDARDIAEQSLAHLEDVRSRLLGLIDEEYFVVSNGRVVFNPLTEIPLVDRGPVLAIIDRLIKVEERIAKLNHLDDIPVVAQQINVNISGVDLDKLR